MITSSKLKDKNLKLEKKENGPIKTRLRKIKGQIGGIERMWEEKKDCLVIVQQLIAATAALKKITELVLTDEVCACKLNRDKQWGEKLRKLLQIK